MYLLSSPDKKNRNCKKNLLMIKESILGTNIFSIRCYLFTFLCLADKKSQLHEIWCFVSKIVLALCEKKN